MKIDAFDKHESMHMASVLASIFEDRVEHTPYVAHNRKLSKKAKKLTGKLWDFYQLVAQEIDKEKTDV